MAITLASPNGYLSLTNVTIKAATPPCFVILDRIRLKLENVTIFSVPVNETSSFFLFLDDDLGGEKNASKSTIKDLGQKCSHNETTVFCDHADLGEVSDSPFLGTVQCLHSCNTVSHVIGKKRLHCISCMTYDLAPPHSVTTFFDVRGTGQGKQKLGKEVEIKG